MKRKLLFAIVALMCSIGTWADTSLLTSEQGWRKLTAIPGNVGDYYYTIVDNDNDLMLSLSRGANQSNTYNGLYYKTSGNPLADKSMLFSLVAEGEYYVMTNVEYNGYFLQTEYNAAQFYRTHDNGGGNNTWGKIKMSYADAKWTIQNGQYYEADGNYLGVWNDNTAAANGQELALNKPSTMKGTYQIYAISKADANAYYDALRAGTGASEENPLDMTGLIVNPNARFWTGSIPFGWTTTGTQNINAGQGFDGFPGIFEFSNWGASSWTGSLKQTITVPNGKYILKAAFMGASGVTAYLTANDDHSDNLSHFGDTGGNINADGTETSMGSGQRGYTYLTVNTKVTNGQIEIGAYAAASAEHVWINADNFTLTYLGADLDILKESHTNALAAANAVDQSAIMEASVLTALQDAISTYTTVSEATTDAYETAINALSTATTNATNSISAYASANAYLTRMNAYLTGSNTFTNFYTTTAYNTYYKNYKDAYDAGTLATATAATLNANAAYSTGWHSENKLDDIMLSTWKIENVQCADYASVLYVNTWSTEGESDGSEFYTPFYEYWVDAAQVLAAKTFTSTITGLKPSTTYTVLIRARVQPTNEQTMIANAIQMQVGSGEAVTISDGNKFGSTNYYIGNFSAVGTTDAEGNLVTTITVAENSNVSWLSFYNVRYSEGEDLSAYIADYEFALNNATSANDNATYANITGKERGDLYDALTTYADGEVDEDNKSELITATNALSTAYNAFVGAKATYDSFVELNANVVEELSDFAITSSTTAADIDIEALVVSNYTAAMTYAEDKTSELSWSNAPGTNSGQSWDGTTGDGADSYYDEYNGSNRSMTATVTLPLGDYILIAKGRASAGGRLTISDGTNTVTFPHKGASGRGIATDGSATFDADATYANSNAGQGWEYRVLTFSSDGSTPVTLTFNWQTSSNNWVGLDDIMLRGNIDYVAANKVTIAANKGDITSLINGEFTSNADGWTGYTSYPTNLGRNWRGEGANPFIERNSTGTMTTTVSNMPAGTYKVVAAARSYDGGKIKAQVAGGTYGDEMTGTGDAAPADRTMEINTNGVEMPYSSLGGFTTVTTGHNWHWISATGTLAADGDLIINFTTTGNNWMAIDDVHLYCTNLDGTSYTRTVGDGRGTINTGTHVVTADIIMENPNTILRSSGKVTTAAGQNLNNNQYNSSRITKLVLYDGYDFTNSGDNYGLDNSATLYRNIPADTWCTLVVPFYPDNLDVKKVPASLIDGVLTFEDAPENGMNDAPMLVKSTEGVTAITGARNSTTGITKGDMTHGAGAVMNGTYSAIAAVPEGSYVVARKNDADALYKVNSTVSLAPFRAYFSVDGGAGIKANVIALNFDELPTAIESISGTEFTVKGAQIYNLAGQRLNKMKKGVNIVNGKKILVK